LDAPHVCRGTPGLLIIALPADFNASMLEEMSAEQVQSCSLVPTVGMGKVVTCSE